VKVLALLFLITACGCAHQQQLSGRQPQATAQIQTWIPIGTPVSDARRILEMHGFRFVSAADGTKPLEFSYMSPESIWDPIVVEGHAYLSVNDGKIAAVQILVSLTGP
jgi:hypothetical protein